MRIRPYRNADHAALVALWGACDLIRPWNDPVADIERVHHAEWAALLLAVMETTADNDVETEAVLGSVMVGFDGHRGWLYYLAVDPEHRGQGYGRALTEAAERFLIERGCPKAELMVRPDNTGPQDFYAHLGYRRAPRAVYAKWLIEPPQPQIEPVAPDAAEPPDPAPPAGPADTPHLDVTVTWLAMDKAPTRPPAPPPQLEYPLALLRLHAPPVAYYRFVQHSIGDPWLWWDRRVMSDEALAEIIHDEAVEIYVLQLGGVPAGMAELDFRGMPEVADLAYLGLMPWAIGRGLGRYLLDWAIDCAWQRDPAPQRLTVNTCTLDHPKALAGYQKAGFEVIDRTEKREPDPRARGLIPPDVTVLSDVPPLPGGTAGPGSG